MMQKTPIYYHIAGEYIYMLYRGSGMFEELSENLIFI